MLGDKKTLRQIAEEYEEVYGVKPKLESKGSMEEGHEKMTALFKQDPKNKWAYLAMFYNYWMLRDETRLTNLDNDRYPGFKPAGFKDVMKKYDRETLGKLAFIM